jgi:hypothetical protein
MHPRQTELLKTASELADKLASTAKEAAPTGNFLWKYTDPDGKDFYLRDKKMVIRSPYSGKSFSAKPVRENIGAVGKELRDDKGGPAPAPGAGAGPGSKVQTKRKKKAAEDWKV